MFNYARIHDLNESYEDLLGLSGLKRVVNNPNDSRTNDGYKRLFMGEKRGFKTSFTSKSDSGFENQHILTIISFCNL